MSCSTIESTLPGGPRIIARGGPYIIMIVIPKRFTLI